LKICGIASGLGLRSFGFAFSYEPTRRATTPQDDPTGRFVNYIAIDRLTFIHFKKLAPKFLSVNDRIPWVY